MGYEMDPCFWTDAGDVREALELTNNGNPGPCRTVCQNGILDIEEECEPFEDLIAVGSGCLASVSDPGDQYEYCSDTCMCKDGWEINPNYDRTQTQIVSAVDPC